ncbi:MAG: LacI family DNA-binding transcriptional regulator [Kiritimatiellae bacterium]|nr:LacI family DNA-binding transcriptional regulator [Kiritimatiellia bacterium]
MKHPHNRSKVGIRQIADSLSLSICTVSRILNDRMGGAKYRAETVERVRRAAAQMGYRPDLVARSLVSGKTHALGLCVGDIANPMFAEFAAHFERTAMQAGYATFTCNIGEDPETERRYVDMLLARRVDALILSPASPDLSALVARAQRRGCRLVVFDRCPAEAGVPRVLVNNRDAMRELTTRALALGHQRVGVIGGNPHDAALRARLEGVKAALRSAGLAVRHALLAAEGAGSTTAESGAEAMRRLWSAPERPTLVLALANVLSIGALSSARALGIRIGEEFSFAGFDDFPGAELMTPPITVVSQPVRRLAEACVRLACGATPGPPEHVELEAALRWRESVRRPPPRTHAGLQ